MGFYLLVQLGIAFYASDFLKAQQYRATTDCSREKFNCKWIPGKSIQIGQIFFLLFYHPQYVVDYIDIDVLCVDFSVTSRRVIS